MGYTAKYRLHVGKLELGYYGMKHLVYLSDNELKPIIEELCPAGSSARYALVENEYVKWRGRKEEMAEISRKYPDFVFTLFGEGEGREDEYGEVHYDDIFVDYYMNGKTYHSSLDTFDVSRLK